MRIPTLFAVLLACAIGADGFASQSPPPQCPSSPLYWEREDAGELAASDVSDCRPTYYVTTPHDVWTLQLNAGDYAVVTLDGRTLLSPLLFIQDPSGNWLASEEGPPYSMYFSHTGLAFRAGQSGTYHVIVTSTRPTDFGGYAIRVNRLTTPIISPVLYASVLGSRVSLLWGPTLSSTPIDYQVLVGSVPGGSDLASFDVGTATRFEGLAPPGVYYLRARGRNAFGVADTPERMITVGPHLSAPGELLITSVLGRRVVLSWSPPATSGTTYYELVVGSAPGLSDLGTFNVGNVLTITIDQVPQGAYYVRLRAANAQGPGAQGNEVVVRVF